MTVGEDPVDKVDRGSTRSPLLLSSDWSGIQDGPTDTGEDPVDKVDRESTRSPLLLSFDWDHGP